MWFAWIDRMAAARVSTVERVQHGAVLTRLEDHRVEPGWPVLTQFDPKL